jgi:hypothetical protein
MTDVKTIKIDEVEYVRKDSINELIQSVDVDGLKAVLIRSYVAGVHFGYLQSEKFTEAGKVVVLVKTRRVFYWDGAASLSQMALEGVSKPQNCKFSVQLESNEIVNVIETIPLTEKAKNNLFGVAIWKS